MICFVCGKIITDGEPKIMFGCDGDFIHKGCEKNVDNACEWINNMTDEEFQKYLLGE